MLTQEEINKRFNDFRLWCETHVYSEPDTALHTNVMDQIIPILVKDANLTSDIKILDVGCGRGYAMQKFAELNCTNIQGITLSKDDAEASRARGFVCTEQDMSFTDFSDAEFDFLFVRHALEHSPYPLLTLKEFNRLLKTNGGAYIEMPSPKCDRLLEQYDNHYSIMGPRQWTELMKRAGFDIADHGEIKFKATDSASDWSGDEVYEWYLVRKI